jgi:thiol:disulfide interchange protein DsbA
MNLRKIPLTLTLLLISTLSLAQPERYLPGRDYTVIANPAPDRTPDVVEVTEFFWYGCPGCYSFEPLLADWIEQQNDDVECLRLPAIWDDWREVHARAYYTADALGVLDDMHKKLFDAMHLHGNRLRDEKELATLFADNGVSEADFSKAYNSFTVNSQINRAKNLAIQYDARSTPSMIVNGKYLVNLSRQTLDIVDFLVRKELMML